MLTLSVEKREASRRKLRELRAEGKMPAILYGKKEESTPIVLSQSEFSKMWKETGESTVIVLEGVGEDKEVLIHDVDIDPILSTPRHADFYVIEKGKKVTVHVPLEFIGTAPAVKELGGTLVKVLHELEIEAMPRDLPHNIEVDVSAIVDFDTRVLVEDIAIPSGVDVITDVKEVVALATPEKEEEEEEAAEAPDISQIEVEKKGKDDEDSDNKVSSTTEETTKEEQKD